jgi:hypothetical protein
MLGLSSTAVFPSVGDLGALNERLSLLSLMGETPGSRMFFAKAAVPVTVLEKTHDLAEQQGDLEQAEASFMEVLALYRQRGDQKGISLCVLNLGALAQRQGDVAKAERLGREGLALVLELRDLRFCVSGLELLASTAGVAGKGERAARLLGAAARVRETIGAPQPPQEQADVAVAAARAALGEEAWAAAYAGGEALSLEQALAEALKAEPEQEPVDKDEDIH